MSDNPLVSTLHAARVALADALKAAATVPTAAEKVAASSAAVAAALANGSLASAAHLLDLDFDCLGAILSWLDPGDALSVARTCTTLRSALFRGGLPGPLAAVCSKKWRLRDTAATKEAALRALDGMEPALGALRLKFRFAKFDEGDARLLARALDAAPRAARIDIKLPRFLYMEEDNTGMLADILSSPDRAFTAPPQVHVSLFDSNDVSVLLRLTRAGVCVASIQEFMDDDQPVNISAGIASSSLTQLKLDFFDIVNLPTRFPALRRLIITMNEPSIFSTDVPSFTALAPLLKEIELRYIIFPESPFEAPKHGFGFDPPQFARFVTAIKGVTRVRIGPDLIATLLQNENENLGQLSALRSLRDLEVSCNRTYNELENYGPPFLAVVARDFITNLPPLPPRLTRLAFSGATRVAFCHPLPGLRVLDWRGSCARVGCDNFNGARRRDVATSRLCHVTVPLAIPSAAIAPNLHTLLVSFKPHAKGENPRGLFDMWTLLAARTTLRVVVIEHANFMCGAPDGFNATTAGFAALLARDAKDLLSVHTHECSFESRHLSHKPAVENLLRALEERGGRVCRAGVKECLFCLMHDGKDLWPLR